MAATLLGLNAKLYYMVGGQDGGGSWVELSNARNVKLAVTTATADVTTRASPGWTQHVTTLKDATISFEMVCDTDDAGFTAIKNAWLNSEPIGIKCLAKENGEGLQADCTVTDFTRSEGLSEAIIIEVTIKVTRSDTPPEWVTGG